jgi:hypothetical protein
MSEKTIAVLDRLVERFDSLKPLLQEHLADNFGEVLPHVLLGELTRHLVNLAPETSRVEELQDVLGALETEFAAGDDEVRELLAVSFLENLPRAPEPGHQLRMCLGPALSAELAAMDSR